MLKYSGAQWDKKVIEVSQSARFAGQAAELLGIHYTTYRRHAKRLGVFGFNVHWRKGKRGYNRKYTETEISSYLDGTKRVFLPRFVKQYLFDKGLKKNVCEKCGIASWNEQPLTCEFHHIDGDRHNNQLSNLQLLCPNCHSQTPNFRIKKVWKKWK